MYWIFKFHWCFFIKLHLLSLPNPSWPKDQQLSSWVSYHRCLGSPGNPSCYGSTISLCSPPSHGLFAFPKFCWRRSKTKDLLRQTHMQREFRKRVCHSTPDNAKLSTKGANRNIIQNLCSFDYRNRFIFWYLSIIGPLRSRNISEIINCFRF